MRRIVVIGCLTLLFLMTFYQKANALSVSPLVFEFNSTAGETVSGSIRVFNEQGIQVIFEPIVQDFLPSDDEGGSPIFLPENTPAENSMQEWVTFDKTSLVLEPNEEAFLNFTIQIPKEAKARGYYGALLLSSHSTDNAISLQTKIGSLVLLSVEGEGRSMGNIKEFSTKNFFLTHLPAEFLIRFENTGTNHLSPIGKIVIMDVLFYQSMLKVVLFCQTLFENLKQPGRKQKSKPKILSG